MVVNFGINKEPRNKLTKIFTPLKSKNCIIKEVLDVENPTFKLQYDSDLFDYNYVYIPELKRYYYFTKPPIIENHEMVIELTEDYLMSHKSDILNSYGHIIRSDKGSTFLVDSLAVNTNKPNYQVTSLGTCFTPKANYIMIKGGQ